MPREIFSKEVCYEAPPVVKEDYDPEVPDEPSPCENCIFYDSIMCEICDILDK